MASMDILDQEFIFYPRPAFIQRRLLFEEIGFAYKYD